VKKSLLFYGLLLLSSPLLAQDFGAVGTEWYYSDNHGGGAPPHANYHHLRSVADTLFQGKTAHKLEITYFSRFGDSSQRAPIYVYEENDTVFLYSSYKARFIAIYIFSAQAGDTLIYEFPEPLSGFPDSTFRVRVDSVYIANIDGVNLKHFKVHSINIPYIEHTIIEQIGGTQWYLPYFTAIPETPGPLRCFSNSLIDTQLLSIACNYRLAASVDEFEANNYVKMYPNPAYERLFVESQETGFTLRITDMRGRLIFTEKAAGSHLELNITGFQPGLYLVEIKNTSGKRSVLRLLKQ